MEVIPLQFTSPKQLNTLQEAQVSEPVFWHLFETEDVLELNTQNWHISTPNITAKIDEWEVNEQNHKMKLQGTEKIEGFTPLDYPFAVSMIGQIGNSNLLQSYLSSLQAIYLTTSIDKKEYNLDENTETSKNENQNE